MLVSSRSAEGATGFPGDTLSVAPSAQRQYPAYVLIEIRPWPQFEVVPHRGREQLEYQHAGDDGEISRQDTALIFRKDVYRSQGTDNDE